MSPASEGSRVGYPAALICCHFTRTGVSVDGLEEVSHHCIALSPVEDLEGRQTSPFHVGREGERARALASRADVHADTLSGPTAPRDAGVEDEVLGAVLLDSVRQLLSRSNSRVMQSGGLTW